VVPYKARLVAQGFSQVPRVDHFDMYAQVAWLASIRMVSQCKKHISDTSEIPNTDFLLQPQ